MAFGISINDLIIQEYGQQFSGSISYDKLQRATECTNQNIYYYYRKLNESNFKGYVDQFLKYRNLNQYIKSDSYIVYFFKNNRLFKTSIRFVYTNPIFLKLLLENLSFAHTEGKYRAYRKLPDSYFAYTFNPSYAPGTP